MTSSLILPYYQNDKWLGVLQKKINSMQEEITKREDYQTTRTKMMKTNMLETHRQTQSSFPRINPFNSTLSNLDSKSNKTCSNFNMNVTSYHQRRGFNNTLYGIQLCTLSKMFPKHRFKERSMTRTRNNFRNMNFVYKNNSMNTDTDKGVQTIPKKEDEIKRNKKQYIEYIKQKSEQDYYKYYYNSEY